jgi:DNA mismatch repair protein MutL
MLDRLDQLRYATREKRLAELIQTACRHAVKGGDPLHESEIEALIREMQETKAPPTCPHGRPVVRRFSRGELERLFKRQQ